MIGEDAHDAQIAGGFAGLAGGVAVAAALVIHSAMAGEGLSTAFDSIAGSLPAQFSAPFGTTLLGVVLHLVVSFGMGTAFGRGVDGDESVAFGLFSGLLGGAFLWAVLTFAVVPVVGGSFQSWVNSLSPGFWFGVHALYGVAVGLMIPPIDRMIRPGKYG